MVIFYQRIQCIIDILVDIEVVILKRYCFIIKGIEIIDVVSIGWGVDGIAIVGHDHIHDFDLFFQSANVLSGLLNIEYKIRFYFH